MVQPSARPLTISRSRNCARSFSARIARRGKRCASGWTIPSRRAEDVAGVLPEAVRLRSDVKLRRALQPLLEDALQLSVQSNPRMLADALFPIFGKAIRKAITAELEGMLQSLSQTLEQRFSWRSLQWRWEAIRTGKPYTEIVVLRSLLFRVEQVFLIHRETGLLLQNVAIPSVRAKDPEMVSAMLTAIQDFVRDSVSSAEHEDLDTIRMGEIAVVLAYGPRAILAAFVRGVPPRNLNAILQNTLDSIEQRRGEALRTFSGDVSDFDSCRPRLQACLVGQGAGEKPASSSRTARALLFGTPLLVVLALVGWWTYSAIVAAALDQLRASAGKRTGNRASLMPKSEARRFYVAGLRDPLAADPASLLPANLPAGKVDFHWEQYHSLAPRFAAQRRLAELKDELERRAFRFATGSADVPPEQRFLLDDVAAQILALLQAAAALGKTPRIEVHGNHDPVGTEGFNSALGAIPRRERALSLDQPRRAQLRRWSAVPEDIEPGNLHGRQGRRASALPQRIVPRHRCAAVTVKKKICMVGQFGVGKTSLVRRFVDSIFDERYLTTVGVKIDRKDVTLASGTMTLMLWDLAGEDDLAQLKISHLRGASGYILVADGCRSASLEKAVELQKAHHRPARPVAFRAGVEQGGSSRPVGSAAGRGAEHGWPVFETSAKAGSGVEEMFLALAGMLLSDKRSTEEVFE